MGMKFQRGGANRREGEGSWGALASTQDVLSSVPHPCCHLVAVDEPVGQRGAVRQELVDDTAMVQAVLGWVTL